MLKMLSAKEKSVQINLRSNYYGSIAEIGGGQETARHLFQAGGASKTVAKTISAYDKSFSDHFYNNGQPSRYVAEERVHKMVECEYNELLKILDEKTTQKFFAFANTVETINYTKTNQGNGWLGIAFEGTERANANRIIIHVKLYDPDTLLQQYTLGTLGINFIHGALFNGDDPRKVLLTLLDNLGSDRVEIDYIYADGPDYAWVDNRILNLMLVSHHMTPAIMFDKEGKVKQPGDMLYKKNVLLMRGTFRPVNNLAMEFLQRSFDVFKVDEDYKPDNTIAICEISLNSIIHKDRRVDEKDFLERVDLLNIMGQSVMVSRFGRYFELVKYFEQFKMIKLRIITGVPTFEWIMDETMYTDLKGGLLESMGLLFKNNVKIYLFPYIEPETGAVIYPEEDHFDDERNLLWKYFNNTKKIICPEIKAKQFTKYSPEYILDLIKKADTRLADFLPPKVYDHIISHQLFDYGVERNEFMI